MLRPLNPGAKPVLDWVSLDRIDVDRNYQRDVRKSLVKRIAENFQWRKFGAVVLSSQGERFNVVEGQHRIEAARHVGIEQVPAIIVEHDETQSEADSFIAINRDRLSVTSIEQYWAGLTAGHAETVALSAVLKAAGCDIVPAPGHHRPNLTSAVTAIDRCIKRYGEGPTRRALLTVRTAWPNDAKSLRGTLITALARIIRANDKSIDDDELAKVIAGQSFAQLTAHAEGFRKLSGGSADTALSRTITELYNRGKRTNVIYFGAAA
jgi:hypothetical protein